MSISIASWNINSVRLRENLIIKFLKTTRPDILCLQETKCVDELLPLTGFKNLGYNYSASKGQKSYNGVLILSKKEIKSSGSIDICSKGDARHVYVELMDGLKIHNFYVPAGGDIPDRKLNEKFNHKINFLNEIKNKIFKNQQEKTVILGDFNIAPLADDVWNHKALLNVVSHTPKETVLLSKLAETGNWVDIFRKHYPEGKLYSWWSYRSRDWKKSNRGRRLDHIWASPDIAKNSKECKIFSNVRDWDRPSDHVPILITL
jgi:exodeoxyribonuclease-3